MADEGGPGDRRDLDARLSFEQSSLPQAFAELDGAFTWVNPALTRLLGYPGDWFLGRHVLSVLHPHAEDRELRAEIRRLARGDMDAISVEVVAAHADGRTLQLLVDASLIRETDGTPRRVALVAHDLTAVRSAEERLAVQERLYRALSHRAADVAVVLDAERQVIFSSPALTDMLGHEPADVLTTDVVELVHPDEQEQVRRTVADVVPEPHGTGRCTARMRMAGDGWRWTEITVINSLGDPDVGGLIVNLRDVTSELEGERALRESEARYRAIVETAQEGIVAIDGAGRVGLANDRLAEILGTSLAELRASDVVQHLAEEATKLADGGGVVRQQVRYAHPDGGRRTLSVSATRLPGEEPAGRLVMVSDVTRSHELQERLRHQALHDQLTGLPNRYLFEDRLEMASARQGRQDIGSTAVMYLDLDRFKAVNDRFGHAVGDRLLVEVGRRLLDVVRASDTVARLGGDEFAVICEGMDEAAARVVAARIQDEVFRDLEHDGHRLDVGASIGIALFPPHDPSRALVLADTAMYEAKRLGGGGVVLAGVDDQADDKADDQADDQADDRA